MEELLEYREKLLARSDEATRELAELAANVPPDRWHASLADGRSLQAKLVELYDRDRRVLLDLFEGVAGSHQDTAHLTSEQLVREVVRLRRVTLDRLRTLAPDRWGQTARHDQFGVRSLQWWVERSLAEIIPLLRALRQL